MSPREQLVEETAALLDFVRRTITRFVVVADDVAPDALALFVMHTWTWDTAYMTPYLVVVSAEKRAGKSRLLDVLELLVQRPWKTTGPTEATLFRKIEQDEPTLLLDEVDAIFGTYSERTEPLRALLNHGTKRGATIPRVVAPKFEVVDFPVFCPKVLAGIETGRLPDTIRDRAIVITMKRRHAGEPVERLRAREAESELVPLLERLEVWAEHAKEMLEAARPSLPEELNDRAADAWEPLLAIADLAGEPWGAKARRAASALSGDEDDSPTYGARILAKAKEAFGVRDALASLELIEALNEDEELPFGGWNNGSGIDARRLAKLLKPYGIKPRTVRVGGETPKGYRAEDFRDPWARWLPPSEAPQAPQAQHAPQTGLLDHGAVADVADVAAPAGPEEPRNLNEEDGQPAPGVDADAELERLTQKGLASESGAIS